MTGIGRAGVVEERLTLYRQAARALEGFYRRHTAPFCCRCLEVTRRHHAADPRADVDLEEGIFPGCCHAGVGEALWVPSSGDAGRFSPALASALAAARSATTAPAGDPLTYRVRERRTGLTAQGVACVHLRAGGCRLGDLKGPLCVVYLCEPVRGALADEIGPALIGHDADDFCGAVEALRAAVGGPLDEARRRVRELEARVEAAAEALRRREVETGQTLWERWLAG